jgi:hypothetical protein
MPRRSEFVIYALLIGFGLILSNVLDHARVAPVPERQQPEIQLPELPPDEQSRAKNIEPGFRMTIPEKPQEDRHRLVSLGTAFAINNSGDWATAQHVSRDCKALVVLSAGGRQGYPVRMVINHPNTDLSVLVTGGAFNRLVIAARGPNRNESGFFVGFPQGHPASVEASFLGSGIVDVTDGDLPGARADRIRGDFWVEDRRAPRFSGSLGGLSGGPVLDDSGSVIGVTVAEEPRRGRVVSISPRYLTELLTGAASVGWIARDNSTARDKSIVTDANFARVGDTLRDQTRVAEVFCYGYRDGMQTRRPRF